MKGKKLLTGILSAMLMFSTAMLIAFADTETTENRVVAKINSTYYETLAAAVEAASDGDTVTLLCNSNGDGIVISKNLTIDFNSFDYTVDGTLVGSPGSETNCFQLLAGSDAANPINITLKNGSITSSKVAKWGANTPNDANATGANIIVQNYSNLTLNDMTINGDQTNQTDGTPGRFYALYVLSNNNGNTVLTGNTNIIAARDKYAFDVCRYSSYPGVTVTLDEKMTGIITGNIEISNSDKAGNVVIPPVANDKFNLIIKAGNVNGKISDARTQAQKAAYAKIGAISGGTFLTDVSEFCTDGFAAEKDETTGQYVIKKTLAWETDTDSGYYMDSENNKQGMMRFMFSAAPSGKVISSGIKYIKADDIAAVPTTGDAVKTDKNSSVFQGDIIKVTYGQEVTYFARAYIVTEDDGIFWSDPVSCKLNWNQFFTDYTGGVQ